MTGGGYAGQPPTPARSALPGWTIVDGRGWSNKDPNSAYDTLTPDQRLDALASWSPVVRERAAMALARRKGQKPVAALAGNLSP